MAAIDGDAPPSDTSHEASEFAERARAAIYRRSYDDEQGYFTTTPDDAFVAGALWASEQILAALKDWQDENEGEVFKSGPWSSGARYALAAAEGIAREGGR